MKVRFIIKEQEENIPSPAAVKTDDELVSSIQDVLRNLGGAQLAALEKYALALRDGASLAEKKMTKPEKENCFADGKYKTFKGKSKCVQRTKKRSKDRANAYTASVLRDMGELPKKKK